MNKLEEDFKTVEKEEEDEENPILILILNSFLQFLVWRIFNAIMNHNV